MKFLNGISIFFCLVLSEVASNAQVSYNITFQHEGKVVFGTFSAPAATGQFPVIIIAPGSGPNDRDGTVPLNDGNSACLFPEIFGETIKMYKELGEALVDSGYAVLRYDKLEYTYPPATLGTITFKKLWLPVESAINYVKTRADVDTNRIILLGHSEGAMLIPYTAKNRTDIKALISVAGSRTPLDTLYASQLVGLFPLLKPCGANFLDSIQLSNLANQTLDYFEVIRSNTWTGSTPTWNGVPASTWADYIPVNDSVSINYNLAGLPALFCGLGNDIQVLPEELERFQNEVSVTDDFWTLPDLIHFMTTESDPHVQESLSDTIIYWLRQNHLHTSVQDEDVFEEGICKAYPNPFTDRISVSLNSHHWQGVNISVYNIFGEKVNYTPVNGNELLLVQSIDLSSSPDGLYLMQVNSEEGSQCIKVLKQSHAP